MFVRAYTNFENRGVLKINIYDKNYLKKYIAI